MFNNNINNEFANIHKQNIEEIIYKFVRGKNKEEILKILNVFENGFKNIILKIKCMITKQ